MKERQKNNLLRYSPRSPTKILEVIDRGKKAPWAIQINRGYAKDLKRGIPTEFLVIVDGTDSNTATVSLSYTARIISRHAKDMEAPGATAVPSMIDFRTRVWCNPDLRSRNYDVPGVISMAIVWEREVGDFGTTDGDTRP